MNYIFEKGNFSKEYYILPNLALKEERPEKKEKIIAFVGKINRNIDSEKEILKRLMQEDFKFKIIGMNSDYFKDIPHEYTKFLPYEQMMKELSKAMFSLLSFNTVKNKNYKNDIYSLPNKFFDSLAAETPVIVRESFFTMSKIVRDLGIGVVINPENINDSVQKIINAYKNYDKIIANIRKHKNKFIWNEKKDNEYLEYISKIMNNGG